MVPTVYCHLKLKTPPTTLAVDVNRTERGLYFPMTQPSHEEPYFSHVGFRGGDEMLDLTKICGIFNWHFSLCNCFEAFCHVSAKARKYIHLFVIKHIYYLDFNVLAHLRWASLGRSTYRQMITMFRQRFDRSRPHAADLAIVEDD